MGVIPTLGKIRQKDCPKFKAAWATYHVLGFPEHDSASKKYKMGCQDAQTLLPSVTT